MGFGIELPDIVGLFTDDELSTRNPGAPSFLIQELEGSRRTTELRGRALPYRGVAWGGRTRTKITWYQGNPVATQQVLGPELMPTVAEGMWKDRFMFGAEVGDESQILVNDDPNVVRTAEAAVALFHDLQQSGNSLKVIWGPQVRTGILIEFTPTYQRTQDVNWRLEFEWRGREDVEARAAAQPTLEPASLLDRINALDDKMGFSPEDVTRAFNAQLLNTVESIRSSVGFIFRELRAIEGVVSTPASVIGAIVAAAESIRLEATGEMARLVESSVMLGALISAQDTAAVSVGVTQQELATLPPGTSAASSPRPASLLEIEAYRREVARLLAELRQVALELARQLQERATPAQIALFTVPQNSSLYQISSRFYGTPDFAGFLARNNGLSSAVVPAGFRLRIPPKPAQGDDGNTSSALC